MPDPGPRLDRQTLVVAGVATLGLIMAVLDTTIVNVALDTLSRDLHAPLSTIQWVSTGYLLSLAAVIPLSGWVTERFGSKRTWIVSIVLFAAGSALCAVATSAAELIVFRVLQGLGGGMLVPVGFTLIAQSAGPRRMGRALALVGVPILLGPIFGPIIGGLIVDNAAWQWIFLVNVPIAVVAVAAAARLLPPGAGRADAGALDWLGAALLCPGLVGIVFGLSETESHGGINHPIAFGPMVAGFALVGLFAWHSLRVPRPLIDLRLFRSPGFRAAATTTLLLGAALFGTLLVLPLYYQVDRGESALNAGLLLAPQGIGAALMLPISGRLTDRLGGGPVVVVGCTVMALATLPLAFVGNHTSYALLGGVLFVRGMGLGASIQPATAAAYALLESSQVPRATAALNTLRQIGGSIGTALLAVVLQHEATAGMPAGSGGAGRVLAPLSGGERAQISGPLATAFGHTFMWAAVMAFLAIVPAVALLRAERARRRPGSSDSTETKDGSPLHRVKEDERPRAGYPGPSARPRAGTPGCLATGGREERPVRAVMAVPPSSLTAWSPSSPHGRIFGLRREEYPDGPRPSVASRGAPKVLRQAATTPPLPGQPSIPPRSAGPREPDSRRCAYDRGSTPRMPRAPDDTQLPGEHNGSMPDIDAAPAEELDSPSRPPVRVVIAGGGIAALEALTALRALAGPRVELTLVAPGHEFVYRPVAIDEPYAVGRSRRIRLDRAAAEAGAAFLTGMVESVDPDAKLMRTSGGDALEYDALVLAVGAQPVPVVPGALTWDDRSDADILGGLMQDLEEGYARRVTVVIPPGPVWPLRAYELALFITLEAQGMSADVETTIVAPEASPLALLTPGARELITTELERAGVAHASATRVHVEPGHPHTVVLEPSGRRFEADRVVALPALRGRPIAGIPAQADGFIEVDEHCRVRGVEGVWAVGDSTAFPLKAGGVAAEQADVAAEDIAASAGAAVEPRTFDPADRDELAGLPAGPFFESWLAESDDPTLTTHLPVGALPPLTFLNRDLQASWRGEI